MSINRSGWILCACTVLLSAPTNAFGAAVELFWVSTSSSEPPEVTEAFARLGGEYEAKREAFDDLPTDVTVDRPISPVAHFQIRPATARGVVGTNAFGTGPVSVPNLVTIGSTMELATLVIRPVGPTASISLALLDLDVPTKLTATLRDGQTETWILPGDAFIDDTLWAGVVTRSNDLVSLTLSPLRPDGYGIDNVEVRRLVPEPATGWLVFTLALAYVSVGRRRGHAGG